MARFGTPQDLTDLDNHRILTFGGVPPAQIKEINWLETAGLDGSSRRDAVLRVNNLYALKRACLRGLGLAILPDYMAREEGNLVQVLKDADLPAFETYFVYPEESRDSKRVNVFRDFLVAKAKEWSF